MLLMCEFSKWIIENPHEASRMEYYMIAFLVYCFVQFQILDYIDQNKQEDK